MAGTAKKILKKRVQSPQPVTDSSFPPFQMAGMSPHRTRVSHVSGGGSFLPFETAGMRKTTKKKMKVGHFGNFFQRGSDLKKKLALGSEKKNSKNVFEGYNSFLFIRLIPFL